MNKVFKAEHQGFKFDLRKGYTATCERCTNKKINSEPLSHKIHRVERSWGLYRDHSQLDFVFCNCYSADSKKNSMSLLERKQTMEMKVL